MSATRETAATISAHAGENASAVTARETGTRELTSLAEEEPVLAAERIMAHLRSPEGCPWDREQTFDSIRSHTLEECYEVFDAIERRDWPALQDELGDLLLQVLFYAQMAAEEGRFTFSDVARSLNAKLIRRHPHIFADATVADSAEVKQNWDQIKQDEKRQRSGGAKPPETSSLLTDVSRHTPALTEARKLGAAAAKVGFDWPNVAGVCAKAHEELDELQAEIRDAGAARDSTNGIEEELGDVLFTMVSLARHLHVDSEMALRVANAKFRSRFAAMEALTARQGTGLETRSPEDLEELWLQAKTGEATPQKDRT